MRESERVEIQDLGAGVSLTGARLLRVARHLSRDHFAADHPDGAPAPLVEFVQIYREWISGNRGRLGTQQEQAEGWQLVCHAMMTAATIEEAIGMLIRFGKVVWKDRGPSALKQIGDRAILVFTEPPQPGPEGVIAAIWPLALTLCELEFLAHARFRHAVGQVQQAPSLPRDIVKLLFAQPISFGATETALVFDRSDLNRPVMAQPADLPQFFRELLPLTLGARRDPPSMAAMTAGLIRTDKRPPHYAQTRLEHVAARLGMSAASLRRRLDAEGTSFRAVKAEVYTALARQWLREGDVRIEEIAARLGYSDAFAFRRAFRRLNDQSPSAYRAQAGKRGAE